MTQAASFVAAACTIPESPALVPRIPVALAHCTGLLEVRVLGFCLAARSASSVSGLCPPVRSSSIIYRVGIHASTPYSYESDRVLGNLPQNTRNLDKISKTPPRHRGKRSERHGIEGVGVVGLLSEGIAGYGASVNGLTGGTP